MFYSLFHKTVTLNQTVFPKLNLTKKSWLLVKKIYLMMKSMNNVMNNRVIWILILLSLTLAVSKAFRRVKRRWSYDTQGKMDNSTVDTFTNRSRQLYSHRKRLQNHLESRKTAETRRISQNSTNEFLQISFKNETFNPDTVSRFYSLFMQNSYTRKEFKKLTKRRDAGVGKQTMTNQSMVDLQSTKPTKCQMKKSCRSRCNSVSLSRSEMFECNCDRDCNFFNDCCADYERYCGNNMQANSYQFDRKLFDCSSGHGDIWMINKCPENWKFDEISSKCENIPLTLSGNNIRSRIPVVCENNTIFQNEYCAQCNQVRIEKYFSLKITCSLVPPASITTVEGKVTFALEYCGEKTIAIFKSTNQYVRKCFRNLRQSCPERHAFEKKCKNGPVGMVSDSSQNYRNIWCSICWKIPSKHLQCGPYGSQNTQRGICEQMGLSVASFSISIDLSSGSSYVSSSCPLGELYDSHLETCWPADVNIQPVKYNVDKYLVVFWLRSNFALRKIIYDGFVSFLTTLFNFPKFQVSNLHVRLEHGYFVVNFHLFLTKEQSLNLKKQLDFERMGIEQRVTPNGWRSKQHLPLYRLLFFSKEFNISFSNTTFTVFKTSSRQLTCINKQTFSPREYTLLENGQYYVNLTGKSFAPKQVFIQKPNANITVCEKVLMSDCNGSRIILGAGEVTKFDNLSILYRRTNTIYQLGEYELENGSIIVCHLLRENVSKKESSRNQVLELLTFITFLLSMASLFLVIQTYAIFSELRRLPGKNLLNLSVSLLLAQLLWITGIRQTHQATICHVTAIIEHYLFLVSFVAMAAIAFHTCSVFASKDVSRNVSKMNENRKFYKYSAVVWAFPAVLVLACSVIDDQRVFDVYVNDKLQVCWFSNKKAQEYFFVLPVGLILTFNVVFFLRTVLLIHHERCEASFVTAQSKTFFLVYIKLFTLMGFSWFFGLLDVLIDSTSIFSYLFVIFASLQGVYIAFAFLFNRRVLTLYKMLIRKVRSRDIRQTYNKSNFIIYRNRRETRL